MVLKAYLTDLILNLPIINLGSIHHPASLLGYSRLASLLQLPVQESA